MRLSFALLALAAAACVAPAAQPVSEPKSSLRAVPVTAPSVREGFLPGAAGVNLFYRVVGSGPQKVLFLHGGPGAGIADGAYELEALASHGLTFIAFDQRGSGRSTPIYDPSQLSVDLHIQDIEAVRRFFGLERVNLLGLSWGSMLGALYADAHPQRVEQIVFLSPGPPAAEYIAPRLARVRETLGADRSARMAQIRKQWQSVPDEDLASVCNEFFKLFSHAYLADPANFSRKRRPMCSGEPQVLRSFFARNAAVMASLGEHFDLRPKLRKLRVPVLVIEGAETKVPLEATREWSKEPPRAQLVLVPGAGHLVWLDQPEPTLRTIARFFAE